MKRLSIAFALALALGLLAVPAAVGAQGGFDQYGYNNSARIFNGTCVSWGEGKYGWTQAQAESYCGVYSNDHVVMKWNAQWDNCNAAGNDDPTACLGASLNNEWNGNVPGGSGEIEIFKVIWVGSLGIDSPYWRDGGYLIWGNYEALMDQGTNALGHWWLAHATPNGYGAP